MTRAKNLTDNAIHSVDNTISDMNLRHHLEDFKIGDNSLTMRIIELKTTVRTRQTVSLKCHITDFNVYFLKIATGSNVIITITHRHETIQNR